MALTKYTLASNVTVTVNSATVNTPSSYYTFGNAKDSSNNSIPSNATIQFVKLTYTTNTNGTPSGNVRFSIRPSSSGTASIYTSTAKFKDGVQVDSLNLTSGYTWAMTRERASSGTLAFTTSTQIRLNITRSDNLSFNLSMTYTIEIYAGTLATFSSVSATDPINRSNMVNLKAFLDDRALQTGKSAITITAPTAGNVIDNSDWTAYVQVYNAITGGSKTTPSGEATAAYYNGFNIT